ncbi:SRPBCC family protein [Flavisolibacter tropicus]|uniref:Activator of HSP90 ATPase n=1 Tax=Flavisolibacter tropicus TaxID=1492898 RepID=A0A172TVL1_9BACT|nr:SRPBCC family protein [Flavisolibacter tropicus]ANE50823.1 activator of HSP90 ATPase [Flavisolibacter tropicus]
MQATKIKVAATIAADIKKVWDYYTQPEHITKWNFADESWHCQAAENDLKVGGKLKSRMEAKDGSFGFDFEAVYDEVNEHKKITYTIADGRQATTEFEDLGGKTQVTIVFDAENANPEEMQKAGWQAILDNFKKYTETH